MNVEKKTGRASIESAKKLAKAHGVDVLGWNEKTEKEFMSVNGDKNKLLLLQKEMEKEGWCAWPTPEDPEDAWPVLENQKDAIMDFGMFPPPPRIKKDSAISKKSAKFKIFSKTFYLTCLAVKKKCHAKRV